MADKIKIEMIEGKKKQVQEINLKNIKKMKHGKKIKEIKKLPPNFSEIAERFASDYLIAQQLHLKTLVEIETSKFPLSVIFSIPKKESKTIFDKIFSKVVDNDKKLKDLFEKADIDKLSIKKE